MSWLITACIITFAISFTLGFYFGTWVENDRKSVIRAINTTRRDITREELEKLIVKTTYRDWETGQVIVTGKQDRLS